MKKIKAKHKYTGEICEFVEIISPEYQKVGTNNVLDNRVFKMEYEIIDDEPKSMCCYKPVIKHENKIYCTGCDNSTDYKEIK